MHALCEESSDGLFAPDYMPIDEWFLEAYESPTVWRYFVELFGSLPDEWIDPSLNRRHPYANKYAIAVIAKALDDVTRGKEACADLTSFVESCRHELDAIGPARQHYNDDTDHKKDQSKKDNAKNTGLAAALRRIKRKLGLG